MCDGLGKLLDDGDGDHRGADESETICAIGDRKPERYESTDTDWQKNRITLDSGSTVDVMPNDEICQVEAVPCTGSRANRTMFPANGTMIESKDEKKFNAITDDGLPWDCAFIPEPSRRSSSPPPSHAMKEEKDSG